ncbi:hypothetical protein ABFU38_08405 [Xanthomonas campestris pv. raphani]|uniref:hypothetical protein n=1 Tax=Xanthomonas campestris TaxID=339 RepID=UPI00389081DE
MHPKKVEPSEIFSNIRKPAIKPHLFIKFFLGIANTYSKHLNPHCGLPGAAPTGQAVWPKASVTNPHKSDSAKNTREEFLIAPLTSSCCYAKLRKSQALKFSKNWLSAIFVDN